MGRETDNWRFIPAKWFTKVPSSTPRRVRVIVWHAMQYTERLDAAEIIANDFNQRPETNKASAHINVDADSIIQCVHDRDVAYGAPGANSDGIQIELAGYMEQTRAQWLDDYGVKMLALACNAAAQYCVKFDLPPIKLTNEELRGGKKGMVGHDQVSAVYRQSDHTDPGPNFPWDYVEEHVGLLYLARLRLRPLI
jgi:N-acetyl-anhydromuramyl-L-alanine amidase AmpD